MEDENDFFKDEDRVLEKFKKEENKYVVEDASELLSHFYEMYDELIKKQKKVNVLITGITGAGKSSLINSIFDKDLAQTGVGKPITQHFQKYSSDTSTINIYDSKGLEHGNHVSFIKSTKIFLDKHMVGKNPIHVVWYVINSAASRWHDFEEKICRSLFSDIPIIFILNKADLTTKRQQNALRKCILNLKLDNCLGVYNVVSVNNKIKSVNVCSSCYGDDIAIKKKDLVYECYECGFTESIKIDNGRDKLVRKTYKILPSFIKIAFIKAQKVSFDLKEEHSLTIIKEFWDNWSYPNTINNFLILVANMMAELSLNWELKHNHQYADYIANNLIMLMSFEDGFKLFYHSNDDKQKIHCTALGILWNRCLYDLTKLLFNKWNKMMDHSHDKEICVSSVAQIFSQLNGINLNKIEEEIKKISIDQLLKKELNQ
jgi:GTP-binding protein EngB required for normal cell division